MKCLFRSIPSVKSVTHGLFGFYSTFQLLTNICNCVLLLHSPLHRDIHNKKIKIIVSSKYIRFRFISFPCQQTKQLILDSLMKTFGSLHLNKKKKKKNIWEAGKKMCCFLDELISELMTSFTFHHKSHRFSWEPLFIAPREKAQLNHVIIIIIQCSLSEIF